MADENAGVNDRRIHAEPTKDFFVKMITRDIALEDCIFDLLDNTIDGARKYLAKQGRDTQSLAGFSTDIEFDGEYFEIRDNCGGILLSDAIDYAFHFGRRADDKTDVAGGIGLYGIGMKRAIFKIGKTADVISEANDACFKVSVNVDAWLAKKDSDWDFEYDDWKRVGTKGARIRIKDLYPEISTTFADAVFRNNLTKFIARDYAFFIEKGFVIRVCGAVVPSYHYQMMRNESLEPALVEYEDDNVKVRIVAGLIDELPDDIPEELTPDKVERYGWYVICNDRVVLAADKSERTIWGVDGYKVWHPQYNGFAGFVFFQTNEQVKLPWTTTKREVDVTSPLYRRALAKMREITNDFAAYTNRRKGDLEAAKFAEKASQQVNVNQVSTPQPLKLPMTSAATVDEGTISYRRPVKEITQIRDHLKRRTMSYREVGVHTFKYFLKVELGK